MSDPQSLVHLVNNDEMLRTALARMVDLARYAVKTCASAGDLLLAESDSHPADCVILDVNEAMAAP